MHNGGSLEISASERVPELQTQYFSRLEGRLAYTDYGSSGELVLMLPGMGSLRSEYRYLAPEPHDAGYRAVTMDLRGAG
jgi:alpha-beta hydrolase superfamily lysophospholipase